MSETLKKKWAVGFHDRGHGHGDFGVIVDLPKDHSSDHSPPPELVVECGSRELAEHIVQTHNAALGEEPDKCPYCSHPNHGSANHEEPCPNEDCSCEGGH